MNGVSHSVEFVQHFVGGILMTRQHPARAGLVAAGHVAAQMRVGPPGVWGAMHTDHLDAGL
ncbi:MAG TPA: hypothetical protein VG099_10150 [Gemmataceae bacterium]|nr:hypothetical protein [Gemmataceae bacterium]